MGLAPAPDEDAARAAERAKAHQELEAENAKKLQNYAWVDKAKGSVQIPIERAMELAIVELNSKKPTAAGPIATPAPSPAASPAASPTATSGSAPTPAHARITGHGARSPALHQRSPAAAAASPAPAAASRRLPAASRRHAALRPHRLAIHERKPRPTMTLRLQPGATRSFREMNPPIATKIQDQEYRDALRFPVLMFLGSAIFWLVIGSFLSCLAAWKLVMPSLLDGSGWLTYGRVQARRRTRCGMGGPRRPEWVLAFGFWLNSDGRLWVPKGFLVTAGAFWNFGVLLGICGILAGDGNAVRGLEFPARRRPFFSLPMFVLASGA